MSLFPTPPSQISFPRSTALLWVYIPKALMNGVGRISPHNTSDKWPPKKPLSPPHPNTHTRTQPVRLSYFLKWSVFAGRRWTNTTGGLRMGTKRKWAEKTKWVENHWKCTLVTRALSNKICELTRTTGKKKNRSKCGVWKATTISGYAAISTNMSHLVAVTGAGTGGLLRGSGIILPEPESHCMF